MHKINLMTIAQQIVNDYLSLKQISRNQLSKMLGISAAIFTFIEKGQHESLSEEMLNVIINALKPNDGYTIIGTANYESIQGVCKQSQDNALMNAVIGYTGAGKSTALYDYYRLSQNVYYLECSNSMNRKEFLTAVLANMGVSFVGSVHEMVKLICKQLNRQEKPLVIIDEAGKINTKILLDLHDIRNATMGNASFIMAGCEYFKTNIEKAVERNKIGYPEFHSRIVNWHILNKPTRAEIETICRENGIGNTETIKDFQRLSNYRQLYNAITNERAIV